MDKFSGDLADEVARLRAEVKELRELVRSRPATTSASLGWRMADMGIPSVGPGEVQIGSNAGDLYVATESGVKRLPAVPGAAPDFPASFTSPATIGGAPNAANYNALRADAAMLQEAQRDLIVKGRASGLWLSA